MENRTLVNNVLKLIVLISFMIFLMCFGFMSCKSTDAVVEASNQNEVVSPSEQENVIQNDAVQDDVTQEDVAQEGGSQEEVVQEDTVQAETAVAQSDETEKEERTFDFKDQDVFYHLKYTYDYEVVGEDLDFKIIVNNEDKEIILQYEETDSNEDWKNNYRFLIWPLNLDGKIIWTTHGYARVYKSAQNIPIDTFCRLIEFYPDYKIIIRGWSFGSAMAKITARHFVIRTGGEVLIDELTTFGDVRCWLNPFFSLKKYCKRIREYVTSNDMITWCVPFYSRDVTCKVGDKFSLKRLRYSEDYHTHYEDYDYSKWE